MQQQTGQTIPLTDPEEALELPEDYGEGSSQLFLSAAFLTAELGLLQKSLDVKIQDKLVSCPGPAHLPDLPLPSMWLQKDPLGSSLPGT